MGRITKSIEEGALFSVPLNDSRYALGLVARRAPLKGKTWIVFGYFFGPYMSAPNVVGRFSRELAKCVLMCGALNLHHGKWRVVGELNPWNRGDWPLTDFYRYEPHTRKFFRVRYDEHDLVNVL